VERTLEALEGFVQCLTREGATRVRAVATGVVREAGNRDAFLELIHRRTGIRVRLVAGAEEARLTGRGVLHGLGDRSGTVLIFDLGGGSTEFFLESGETLFLESVPVGAAVLTKAYLAGDPPGEDEVARLCEHIDACLNTPLLEDLRRMSITEMAATGGTATTLAAMVHGIPLKGISPERMNGLRLRRTQVEALFQRLSGLPCARRAELPGLDEGRAGVITAGALAVIRIMDRFSRADLAVSLSDLLEGILIEDIEGERHG
jgi:exopolyphosphatase/guanosine-5'-triphosphate,3'-diphosphate pyrophosphatase